MRSIFHLMRLIVCQSLHHLILSLLPIWTSYQLLSYLKVKNNLLLLQLKIHQLLQLGTSPSTESESHSTKEVSFPENVLPQESSSASLSTLPMLTRSKAGIVKPNPRYALATDVTDIFEPSTIKQALSHSGLKAMEGELAALEENNTWDLVPRTPDMNIIGTK